MPANALSTRAEVAARLRIAWAGIHSPPSATDRGRLTPRQRRLGHDRRPAQDAALAQRHEQQASFEQRFPVAARVEIWGSR